MSPLALPTFPRIRHCGERPLRNGFAFPAPAAALPPGIEPITPREVIERALELSRWKDHPARTNFEAFLQEIGRTDGGDAIGLHPYVRIFADLLKCCHASGRHLSHVSPPGIGKSTIARLYCLFNIGNDPTLRAVFTGADLSTSISSVALLRDIIINSTFRSLFPQAIPDESRSRDSRGWMKEKFFFKLPGIQQADATLMAKPMEMQGQAIRTDFLLVDDAVTLTIAESQEMLKSALSSFYNTWLHGRTAHGGWIVSLQNCWTDADLAHRLTRDDQFCSFWVAVDEDCDALVVRLRNAPETLGLFSSPESFHAERIPASPLPSVRDHEDFGAVNWDHEFRIPLPPLPKWTREEVEARSKSNPAVFSRLSRLIAVKPGDLMLPSWTGRQRPQATVAELLGLETEAGKIIMSPRDRLRFAIAAGIDISGMTRHGCAVWFLAKDNQGRKYPLETYRGAFTIQEIIAILDDAWSRGIYPGVIHVENNGVQDLIVQVIKTLRKDNGTAFPWQGKVVGFHTGKNKMDPSTGLPGMDVEFANKIIVWPGLESSRTDSRHAAAWRITEQEMANLPRLIPRAKTPDGPMGLWFAWLGLDRVSVGQLTEAARASTVRYKHRDGLGGSYV